MKKPRFTEQQIAFALTMARSLQASVWINGRVLTACGWPLVDAESLQITGLLKHSTVGAVPSV